MAGYQRCISLALACLLLCHYSLEVKRPKTQYKSRASYKRMGPYKSSGSYKSKACTYHKSSKAYKSFLNQHVREGAPKSANADEWLKFLGKNGLTGPVKSFLKYDDLRKVKAVCSNKGGKQYMTAKKLCISNNKFVFFTVRRNRNGKENVYSVIEEHKHLILACENCLPIHFEQNPNNNTPVAKNKGCRDGTAK